jgi:hypothetical protein
MSFGDDGIGDVAGDNGFVVLAHGDFGGGGGSGIHSLSFLRFALGGRFATHFVLSVGSCPHCSLIIPHFVAVVKGFGEFFSKNSKIFFSLQDLALPS